MKLFIFSSNPSNLGFHGVSWAIIVADNLDSAKDKYIKRFGVVSDKYLEESVEEHDIANDSTILLEYYF